MTDTQFFSLLGTLVVMLSGLFGWIIAWIKSLDSRISHQEIQTAVIEAILKERKK